MLSNLLANNYSQWILLGVLVVVFGLFLIFSARSNKKKQKEADEMMTKFQKGCTVMTIGGIMGKVIAINDKDNYFVIETGTAKNKTYLKLSKQALYSVVSETKNPNATNPEITEADMNGEVVSPEEVATVAEDNASTENTSVAEAEEAMDAIEEIEEATDEDNK